MTMTDSSTKKCYRCKKHLPIYTFNKNKAKPDGLSTECKSCVKELCAAAYLKTKERRQELNRINYQENKEAYKARARNWEKENAEKKRELRAGYRERNREKIKEFSRTDWLKHAAKRKAKKKEYRQENPGKCMEHVRARQTRKQRAMPTWANREAIKNIYVECAEISRATGIKHHVDHYYPLKSEVVCGLHNEYNLRIIPATQNQSKGNSFPE